MEKGSDEILEEKNSPEREFKLTKYLSQRELLNETDFFLKGEVEIFLLWEGKKP